VPDLEFRLASKTLELEQSGLTCQRVPTGTWRGYEAAPEGLEDVEGRRDRWAA
jgi:hypothetical protein